MILRSSKTAVATQPVAVELVTLNVTAKTYRYLDEENEEDDMENAG